MKKTLLLILACALCSPPLHAGNAADIALDGEAGYRTNLYIALDSSADSTQSAYRNSPFLFGEITPSYRLSLKNNWTASTFLDVSSTYYTAAYTTVALLPGISFEHNEKNGRLVLKASAGYSRQPPDEQDPGRAAEAIVAGLAGNYILKFSHSLDFGYSLDLMHDALSRRLDMTNAIKAKLSLNISPKLRAFGKLGLVWNTSSDSGSSYGGFIVSPGAIFMPSEKNTFLLTFYLESRTYDVAATQTGLGKMPFSGGGKNKGILPHAQATGYYTILLAYDRSLTETLDFSLNYGLTLFSPGNNESTIASHKVSAELSWALQPL
ncbi:MAG: hypothetical protein PHC61_06010 [Chitinivibrionales bacterium]|nr:hypothetical protein [Chitinivibrionales bacterium]